MKFLKEIGPDTLIPCFSVNIRDNEDVNQCNAIISAIFNDLSQTSTEESEQRIPMIVTSSTMQDHKYSSTLEHFKERLGVRNVQCVSCYHIFRLRILLSLNGNKNSPNSEGRGDRRKFWKKPIKGTRIVFCWRASGLDSFSPLRGIKSAKTLMNLHALRASTD